jgi:hypothetical protein
LAVIIFVLTPSRASTQEVGLVAPDAKDVAKGYRASALELKSVVNDKGEIIGQIDDFIFGRDNGPVFAVLAVGDFVGVDGELVAVPFRSSSSMILRATSCSPARVAQLCRSYRCSSTIAEPRIASPA